MSENGAIDQWVHALLGNPFEDPVLQRRAVQGLLDRLPEVRTVLLESCEGDDARRIERTLRVERTLLALGHAQLRASKPAGGDPPLASILAEPAIGRVVWSHARPRSELIRVLAANHRCFTRLRELKGRSEGVARVCRQTWSACFGPSLDGALEREQLVRDANVLLRGESGTGKEVVARAIQDGGLGDDKGGRAPAIQLNVAALPEALVESELFGHKRGAFTGAVKARRGKLVLAHRGSAFLDEIGDLPLATQVKLLRAVETNMVEPVGGDRAEPADVRYVAATSQPIEKMAEEGGFRLDLLMRLATLTIAVPPLRERPEDIFDIGVSYMDEMLSKRLGDESFPPAMTARRDVVEEWLDGPEVRNRTWKGNVRELRSAINALLLGFDTPSVAGRVRQADTTSGRAHEDVPERIARGDASFQEVEHWYVGRVLARNNGNHTRAARTLGVASSTLLRMKKRGGDGNS